MKSFLYRSSLLLLLFAFIVVESNTLLAQETEQKSNPTAQAKRAREYAMQILDGIYDLMKEHYYDRTFHGIDLKKRIEEAKARLKTLEFNWQMYRVPAQVLMELNDSHTRLLLPPRSDNFDYGVRWQMIGDDCFVTSVSKKSDAFKKGLEPGDQILKIGKATPTSPDLWKINFVLYSLDPAKEIELSIRKPDNTEKTIRIAGSTTSSRKFWNDLLEGDDKKTEIFRCAEMSKEVIACKLNTFIAENQDIEKMMKQAHPYPKMILDLRGNGGGYVSIEENLLGYFFEKEVKIADMISRSKTETRISKPAKPDKVYNGQVAVIVDSRSASAAELTARVLQLEKRAKVYGDFSSGSVMTSIAAPIELRSINQNDNAELLGAGMSITIGDVIMKDGSRLEGTGVVPDTVLQPGGMAFKLELDPVLSYVAQMFRSNLDPIQAGKLHFLIKDEESDKEEKKPEK